MIRSIITRLNNISGNQQVTTTTTTTTSSLHFVYNTHINLLWCPETQIVIDEDNIAIGTFRDAKLNILTLPDVNICINYGLKFNRFPNLEEYKVIVSPPILLPQHFQDLVTSLLEKSGDTCPICLNGYKKDTTVITKCFHCFCGDCITACKTCPICRTEL